MNIPAGDWAVFSEGSQPPAFIKAVESPDANTTAPAAALTLTLGDFYFGGLDAVASGSRSGKSQTRGSSRTWWTSPKYLTERLSINS